MATLTPSTHPGLRLTPSNSPFARNPSPRSPTRRQNTADDAGLQLRKVIGTTTSSANAFDSLPSARCFAYAAGAAAVVATVEEDLSVKQRFFRARPAQYGSTREGSNGYTASPSPLEPRNSRLSSVRQSNVGGNPLSSSVNGGRDWSDSPTGRSATAKERVKAATSVALSPNGKWLAVGETGYKPRVLIFSLAEGSSDSPLAATCEHMYGVHCLRFSDDSRFLASLGTVNDGFLYIWSVNDRTGALDLYASNKLTTLVNCIAWVGKSLITVGLRFVKVWRPGEARNGELKGESTPTMLTPRQRDISRISDFGKSIFSPRHKTLHGKNSLLDDLLDCNFVSVLAVGDNQAVICAESGEICVLEDVSKTQQLRYAGSAEFAVSAARLDDGGQHLILLSRTGKQKVLNVDRLERELAVTAPAKNKRQTIMPIRQETISADAVTATALLLGGMVVEMSLNRAVTLKKAGEVRQLPAHMDAILGVKAVSSPTVPSARFFSFSGAGTILFWNEAGEQVHSLCLAVAGGSDFVNEIKAVTPSSCGKYLIVGDKLGVVRLIDVETNEVTSQLRAHAAEVMDISAGTILENDLVATAGRDRVVQLFSKTNDKLVLLQTLDEHAGAVGGVLLDTIGRRLISHSNDRTVVIREVLVRDDDTRSPLAFSVDRTVALKSSPTAIALCGQDQLLVAAVDRCIARYSLYDGQCAQTFKCSDNDGGEAVVASQLVHLPASSGVSCVAAACSADKSVRLYTDYGALLARDWGHTEGITDIAAFSAGSDSGPSSTRLVTVAADSTMYIWDTSSAREARPSFSTATSDGPETPSDIHLDPPMRRVISTTELSYFTRQKSHTTDEGGSKSSSPTSYRPLSPHRLRKKTSRSSIAQPPRLEPTTGYGGGTGTRRASIRHRSPSPPSPRAQNRKRESMRRKSMATLRTKSSETVLRDTPALPPAPVPSSVGGGFGTLTSSSESMCRTLRTYRKKLVTATDSSIEKAGLQELDKELRLTLCAIVERCVSLKRPEAVQQDMDETSVSKFLDQASERLVAMVDGRIKERLEGSTGVSSLASSTMMSAKEDGIAEEEADSIAGALEAVSLNGTSRTKA